MWRACTRLNRFSPGNEKHKSHILFVLLKRSIYTVRRVFNMLGWGGQGWGWGNYRLRGPRLSGAPPSRSETPEKKKKQRIKKGRRGQNEEARKRNPESSVSTERVALVHLPVRPRAAGGAERGRWVKSLCITKGGGGGGAAAGSQIEVGGGSAPPLPSAEGAISPDWSSYSRSQRSCNRSGSG